MAEMCFSFFFFSSRRRHTRYIGDWSSDVCSSDLDRGQVEPALPAAHVLDVGDPQLVGCARPEVAFDQVAGSPQAGHPNRRPPIALRHQPREPEPSHQPLDALAPDLDAAMSKRGVDAAGAVGLPALGVDLADLLAEPGVGEVTVRRRPPLPGVEARAADAEHPAERLHGVLGLPRGDEPKDAHRFSPSFAKKAAAFFKISRSSRSTLTSRRRRRSSSCSSLLRPSRSPASTAAWRVQIRSVSVETPRSDAISVSGRPLRRYSATASRRNSGGYGFWKFAPLGMGGHPSRQTGLCRPSAQVSTKAGAFHLNGNGLLP